MTHMRLAIDQIPMPLFSLCTFLCLGILLGGCASAKQDPDAAPAYKTLAQEKYGTSVAFTANADSTIMLCVHTPEPSPRMPTPILSYLVYDLETEAVLYEEEGVQGEIKWTDGQTLSVTQTPGIVTGNETSGTGKRGYTVDVRTGQKRKL